MIYLLVDLFSLFLLAGYEPATAQTKSACSRGSAKQRKETRACTCPFRSGGAKRYPAAGAKFDIHPIWILSNGFRVVLLYN